MSHETPVQPKLAELLARYLDRQAEAHALGTVAEPGEVTPYEAGPVQPIEPRLAWSESLAALGFYGPAQTTALPALPHWPALVAGHEPVVALPLALGNFPQLVRSFHQLLHRTELARPQPAGVPVAAPQLREWADTVAGQRQFPQVLLALGGLRLAKQFDVAKTYTGQQEPHVPQAWRAGWENEKAALAWHSGECEQARQLWHALEPSAPVLFNRGVAELFLGQPGAARAALEAAAERLPENSAWQHLAQLYLTLAQMR
jgi:hypothetical protein